MSSSIVLATTLNSASYEERATVGCFYWRPGYEVVTKEDTKATYWEAIVQTPNPFSIEKWNEIKTWKMWNFQANLWGVFWLLANEVKMEHAYIETPYQWHKLDQAL